MTQRERVLEMLRDGPKSSLDFYREFIPRFPARIHELREKGFHITDKSNGKYKVYTLHIDQPELWGV